MHGMPSTTSPTPYVHFPGTAREALTFYSDVFGGTVEVHTYAEFGRHDGPAEAIAHGEITGGPVALFGADATGSETSIRCEGLMLALLGSAAPATMRDWFSRLSDSGRVTSELQTRPWGATDGQVIDRHGLHWLIGFEAETED